VSRPPLHLAAKARRDVLLPLPSAVHAEPALAQRLPPLRSEGAADGPDLSGHRVRGCSTGLVRTGGAVAQSEQVASCSFRANQKQWLLPQAGGFECFVRIEKELDAGAFPYAAHGSRIPSESDKRTHDAHAAITHREYVDPADHGAPRRAEAPGPGPRCRD
jgi:hypothetical protein